MIWQDAVILISQLVFAFGVFLVAVAWAILAVQKYQMDKKAKQS